MKIENYGSCQRCLWVEDRLRRLDDGGGMPRGVERIILLPIPTTRDGVHINGADKLVSEVLFDIEPGDFVAGYGIPAEDIEIIKAAGGVCFDAARDEKFLIENAHLTALGTLGYILSNFKKTPDMISFGIVGYGRIGSRLADLLLYFGAPLRVFTTKNSTRVLLGEYGIPTSPLDPNKRAVTELDGIEVLINTAPTPLYNTFPHGVPEGMTVLELASGNNFAAEDRIIRLPSIPDRMFHISAAKAYYEAIARSLFGGALW